MIGRYAQPTLKELVKRVSELSEDYDVYIKGRGDGSVKLVIEEKALTLIK